jgi:Lipocalin-like domain
MAVEFADLDKDGKWRYWFGEHPRGYFVYDATGHVHIQIVKVPPLLPFPEANSDDGKLPSAEHALAAYTAYAAYFGTYTVDSKRHVVTHHVQGSLAPDYTDTDQPRPFKLTGNRLEITMVRPIGEDWSAFTDLPLQSKMALVCADSSVG